MGPTFHRKNNNHQTQVLRALLLSIWAVPAMALDLGRLQILSGMGEPLRAEVEITQALPNELSSLRVQLAAPSVFGEAGMEFNPALDGVTATLQTRSNGAPFIELTGTTAVRENFIDLILETQWATGRLVKNYALLLNSVSEPAINPVSAAAFSPHSSLRPLQGAAQVTTTPAPLVQSIQTARTFPLPDDLTNTNVSLNAQNVPVYRFESIDNSQVSSASRIASTAAPKSSSNTNLAAPKTSQTTALSAPAVLAQPSTSPQSGNASERRIQVRQGDTASQLAMGYLAANVSMDQMLLAMLKANPNAFIQGNVNLVKAGAVLRMPSAEEAQLVPRDQARRIVLAQTRDFAEYARRIAQAALLVDGKNTREISGKVGVEKSSDRSALAQQDRLTLSNSSVQDGGAEAALASAREAEDSSVQLAELNQNLRDLEALVNGQPAPSNLSGSEASSLPANAVTAQVAVKAPEATGTLNDAQAAQPDSKSSTWLQDLQDNKQLWAWAAAFLALIFLFVFWARRKSGDPEPVYSPSYDDIPSTSTDPVMDNAPVNSAIPPQMSAIDLNLQTSPSASPAVSASSATTVSPPAPYPPQTYAAPSTMAQSIVQPVVQAVPVTNPGPAEDTEQSKLNLATQLLAKGDKDLARALILSVISSSTGELKAKAIQLLGQIR